MELKQSLGMRQELVMTPQLQMAIKLLGMSYTELLEQVREEVEKNPLLEQPEEPSEGTNQEHAPGEASLDADNQEGGTAGDSVNATSENAAEEFKDAAAAPGEIDWDAYLNSYQFNEPSTASNKGNVATDDLPSFEANLVKKEDLTDVLNEQLGFLRLNDAERRVAQLIIGNLNDDGYLILEETEGDPLIHLANEADVSLAIAERTLRKIQQLEPKGCGARDLQECLLVQLLTLKDPGASLLGTIIKKHMKYLQTKNYPAIAKDLKISVQEVATSAKLLTQLNPKPGRNFTGADDPYITPDVFIYKMGDDYTVVLNDDGLSKLRISSSYRDALRNGATGSGQTKAFIQEKLRSAKWLITTIHRRQTTIYKVTESIVKFQREFLEKGMAYLKPIILRDVADDIGMHESTVSRVTRDKYVHTPQGIFELKALFHSSISSVAGDDTSSEAVRHHIKQLVAEEKPEDPYSDQKLVELLRARGIDIARRTVAKYRDGLKILPSSKRKKYV